MSESEGLNKCDEFEQFQEEAKRNVEDEVKVEVKKVELMLWLFANKKFDLFFSEIFILSVFCLLNVFAKVK